MHLYKVPLINDTRYYIYIYIYAYICVLISKPRIFSRVDNTLSQKTDFNKFFTMEIMCSIFYEHSGMKLENNKEKFRNSQICGY